MEDLYSFDSAKEELRLRLGGRTAVPSQDFDKRLERWLDSAQAMLAKSELELPRLDQINTTAQVVNGTSEYNLRNLLTGSLTDIANTNTLGDFIGLQLVRNDTDDIFMSRFPFADYRKISSQASGSPTRWTRKGTLLVVDPKPDDTYELRIDYRRRPRLGVVEVDTEWQESWLQLATFIGWRALDEMQKASGVFQQLPAAVQFAVQRPLGEEEWEALWDDRLAIVPNTTRFRVTSAGF